MSLAPLNLTSTTIKQAKHHRQEVETIQLTTLDDKKPLRTLTPCLYLSQPIKQNHILPSIHVAITLKRN